MRKLTIISTLFAGTLALGCGSMRPDGASTQPNNVTGQAATTTTGVDSTGNPAPGTATGTPPGTAADPNEQPGVESGATRDTSTAPKPNVPGGQGTKGTSTTDAAGDDANPKK